MNITYLIGNGFDLNLGLRTRYTDFYDYYLNNTESDTENISKLNALFKDLVDVQENVQRDSRETVLYL